MAENPLQKNTAMDANVSEIKLSHPDPEKFSIITNHADYTYITFSKKGLNQDESERIWKMLVKKDRLLNFLNIAWVGLWMGTIILFLPALFVLVAIFGMVVLQILAWFILLSLIPCIYLFIQEHRAIKTAQKLEGTVVSYSEIINSGDGAGTLYALNVEYCDQVGMKHIITSKTFWGGPSKEIGDQVIVLSYADGSPPKLFLFDDIFMQYCIWLFAIILAGCFLLAPYWLEWF